MLSNTIYFTLVFAVIGLTAYLYRYIDATKRKLGEKPSESFKDTYKDL